MLVERITSHRDRKRQRKEGDGRAPGAPNSLSSSSWEELAGADAASNQPSSGSAAGGAGGGGPSLLAACHFLAGSTINGQGGIGYMTLAYSSQLKTPALFATGFVACLLGFIFVGGVNLLHWYLLHKWHDSLVKKE